MYQFEEKIDYESLFVFDKRWIKNMNWAVLPKSSKAIFPVILSHCNGRGLAFPSERRIAILSGRPDKSVRAGIKGLRGFPGFKVGSRTTNTGKRGKQFHIKLPAIEQGACFPFRRCVIYAGNWCLLSPTAMALYPVMRHFGFFDFDQYCDLTDIEANPSDFDEIYAARTFDFCEADLDIMAEHAGIACRSIKAALDRLTTKFLIEEISPGYWKVFIKPPNYFYRSDLNQRIKKRYKHENKDGKNDR